MNPIDPAPNAPSAGSDGGNAISVTLLEWLDIDGRPWTVELSPQHIVFRGESAVIELRRESWPRDLFVSRNAESFLIRVETFAASTAFSLSAAAAMPFLAHLQQEMRFSPPPPIAAPEPSRSAALLWPRVSAVAVWALICASLSFVPVLGFIPAMIGLILLLRHRRAVRRADAWRHSRAICTAAAGWMVIGLAVNLLSSQVLLEPAQHHRGAAAFRAAATPSGVSPGIIASIVVVVLLSLTVHEAAHAIAAWWQGDGLARSLGRVSLNPLAHIDAFGTILLPAALIWMGGPAFGYAKPVPVQTDTLPNRHRAQILISLAGPGSNLLMAAASLMLLVGVAAAVRLLGLSGGVINLANPDIEAAVQITGFTGAAGVASACTVLKSSFVINTVLAVFNLIPIPPLDGSWILEHSFPWTLGRLYSSIRPYGMLIFVAAIYTEVFPYLMQPVIHILQPGFLLIHRLAGVW